MPINENPTATDWAADRGKKWLAHLDRMEATLAPVDNPLIAALNLDTASRIAEVGCGGGATILEIARRAPAGAVVHGFDVSPALIDAARRRAGSGNSAIAFEVADMATVSPPTEPYDRLVSRFGIMFFDDPLAAFANLARWIVPGGRFAFAAWGLPAENISMTTIREVVAEFISLPTPDPEAPGPFRYADAGKLLALLDHAGFGELNLQTWRGSLPVGGNLSPAEAAAFALASFGNFSEQLTESGNDAYDKAIELLTSRFEPHYENKAVRLDAAVHIFAGARAR